MKSIWISKHAIERYASRVEDRDPDLLTVEDRERIKARLLDMYQHSKPLSDEMRKAWGVKGRLKNATCHLCVFRQDGKRIAVALICQALPAWTLLTVIKIRHRSL